MRRVDPGLGLLCELPAGEAGQAGGGLPLTPGYAHISNLSDEQVEDLAKVGVGGGTAVTGLQRVVLLLVWLVQLGAGTGARPGPGAAATPTAKHAMHLPAYPPGRRASGRGSVRVHGCWDSDPWTAWRCCP